MFFLLPLPHIFLQLALSVLLCSTVTLRSLYSLPLLFIMPLTLPYFFITAHFTTWHYIYTCLLGFFLLRLECSLWRTDCWFLFCSWMYHQYLEYNLSNGRLPETFLEQMNWKDTYKRLKQGHLITVIKREYTRPIIIVLARLKHKILRFN